MIGYGISVSGDGWSKEKHVGGWYSFYMFVLGVETSTIYNRSVVAVFVSFVLLLTILYAPTQNGWTS